jgi:hypothetical protein
VGDALQAVEAETLDRMLRYALGTGADLLQLQPGHRPLIDGMGGPREVRFRQLTGDDTRAIASLLLERAHVPDRLRDAEADAGHALGWWVEIPGQALLEVAPTAAPGGIGLRIDLIRAFEDPTAVEVLDF